VSLVAMFLMRGPHRLDPLPCLIYADAKRLTFDESKAPAESLTFVQHVADSVSTNRCRPGLSSNFMAFLSVAFMRTK
jgi:hypothetical protein